MADKKTKTRGLGRGLSALMSDVAEASPAPDDTPKSPDRNVPIESVVPNPDQPRRSFDKDALQDLANSIREKGIIQPLIVRPQPGKDGMFEIVAGERRWRAAQIAQLHQVPVIVRDFNDTEVLEVAIIENIQRADLNPVEEASGYSQLMEKFGHTQEKLATALGKSRSHIANSVRLLTLPDEVLDFLKDGRLSAGHARALVPCDDPLSLARQVVKKGLSVRETEDLAKSESANIFKAGKKPVAKRASAKDADTRALEADLSAIIGMKVTINMTGAQNGQLSIGYDNLDQLDDLCALLSSSK